MGAARPLVRARFFPPPSGPSLARGARCFTAFTTGIIYLGVYGFMGTFLAERCGLSSTPAGLLMMFYGLACLAGGSLSGRIGGWRGLRGTILVGEASGIAAAGLLLVSTVTGSWVPALVAAACLGLGYILVQPTLVSLSMDVDPAQTGLCTGLIGFGVFVGGGTGSTLGGFAISAGRYEALWIAAAAAWRSDGHWLAGLAPEVGVWEHTKPLARQSSPTFAF